MQAQESLLLIDTEPAEPRNKVTCPRCNAWWAGTGPHHCAACHMTANEHDGGEMTTPDTDLAAALELIGKQPDVVAVKLPEPSYVDEPEVGAKGYGFNGDAGDRHLSERGVYAHDGMVYDQWDSVSPDDARKIGSWWLAAAARAEAADGAQ